MKEIFSVMIEDEKDTGLPAKTDGKPLQDGCPNYLRHCVHF
jgi:hypothetical protein